VRRRRFCSVPSPMDAERRRVTNFQPFPPQDVQGPRAGAVSGVMPSIIMTRALRLYAVTVYCPASPSHQCLVAIARLR
jgi:hypothetical protein